MTGWNMPPGANESDIPGNRPQDLAWDELCEWIANRARELAHAQCLRCTGGRPHKGILAPDGERWHSKKCDDLTEAFSEAMREAAEQASERGL